MKDRGYDGNLCKGLELFIFASFPTFDIAVIELEMTDISAYPET